MPSIKEINIALEKKVDLTRFFGEEAFITIKRIGKYNFTYLLNKNRSGYTAKLFELVQEWKVCNPEAEKIPAKEYDNLKNMISPEESEERLKIETEVNRNFYEFGIKKDGHNFTDEEGKIIELEGGWFYDQFAGLVDSDGRTLDDLMVNEIVGFNHKGLVLGESNASK